MLAAGTARGGQAFGDDVDATVARQLTTDESVATSPDCNNYRIVILRNAEVASA